MAEDLEVIPIDIELQFALVKNCLQDNVFVGACEKYLKKNYFDNTYLGWIFGFIVDFYRKYSHSPSVETIKNELLKFSPEERVPYNIILEKIVTNKFKDIEYLKKEVTKWTKKKFLFDSMKNFTDMYQAEETDDAYEFMHTKASELLNINYDKSQTYDFNKIDSVLDYAKNSYKYRLRLGIPQLDDLMLGGVAKQNVCLFIGPMHSGKSIILINVARNFIEQGAKVLYLDLENDLRQLVIRMLSSFSQISYKNFFRAEGLSMDEKDRVLKTQEIINSSLFLRSITDFTVYVENIIPEIKQLHLQHKFDAVVIDYSQILKIGNYSKMKKHEYLEEIMRGLSCLARELDVAVVTAAQGNRAGQEKAMKSKSKNDTLDITDIADAFAMTRVVNPIITITKSQDDDKKKRIRLKLAKNRDGSVSTVVACEADFDSCRLFSKDLMCRVITDDEEENEDDSDGISQLEAILKNSRE